MTYGVQKTLLLLKYLLFKPTDEPTSAQIIDKILGVPKNRQTIENTFYC